MFDNVFLSLNHSLKNHPYSPYGFSSPLYIYVFELPFYFFSPQYQKLLRINIKSIKKVKV